MARGNSEAKSAVAYKLESADDSDPEWHRWDVISSTVSIARQYIFLKVDHIGCLVVPRGIK